MAINSVFVSALMCLFGLALACLLAFRHKRPAEPLVYHTLADIQDILSGKHLAKVTLWRPASTLLRSRAVPNERLIRAFGIDNAFTTTDEAYHKEFLREAKGLLQQNHGEWQHLGEVAEDLTKRMMREGEQNGNISLVTVVQVVALKIAIHVLFNMPIDRLADGTINSLAKTINKLWIGSKTLKSPDSSFQKHQKDLEDALQEIFPTWEGTPRSNPLNFILPAYETLWRVVLRCFVEVKFRSGAAASSYHGLFRTFLSDPTQKTFAGAKNGISVSSIVSEALRLYPPRGAYTGRSPGAFGTSQRSWLRISSDCTETRISGVKILCPSTPYGGRTRGPALHTCLSGLDPFHARREISSDLG